MNGRVPPKVSFVSLGCPKALVDSERILTQLRAEGYGVVGSYDQADLVVVNTCGFIDSAVEESLDAIGEALAENGKVIVTGCLGAKADRILTAHPNVLAVTGAHAYEQAFLAIRQLGLGMEALEQQFRRMAFNVIARNQDDHVKNIAFL